MKKWVFGLALAIGACSSDASSPSTVGDAGTDVSSPSDAGTDTLADAGVDPLSWPLEAPGPFQTGYHLVEYTYEPIPGFERTINVNIWYPTLATEGVHPKYLGNIRDDVSWTNAEPAAPVWNTYPVHVHSHGDRGFGATSVRLVRHFVSHGWVVVAPDHTQNTTFDNVQPRPVPLYHWRTQDITESLNALERATGTPVAGKVDTSQVLMSGHSYGGFTAWPLAGMPWNMTHVETACAESTAVTACEQADIDAFAGGSRDPRIVAAVAMAGGPGTTWLGEGPLQADVAMMTLSGTDDPIGQQEIWDRTQGLDYTWVDIEGACHQAFALGGCAGIATEVADAIVFGYVLAFGRQHVLGDTRQAVIDLLSGDTVPEGANFQKR